MSMLEYYVVVAHRTNYGSIDSPVLLSNPFSAFLCLLSYFPTPSSFPSFPLPPSIFAYLSVPPQLTFHHFPPFPSFFSSPFACCPLYYLTSTIFLFPPSCPLRCHSRFSFFSAIIVFLFLPLSFLDYPPPPLASTFLPFLFFLSSSSSIHLSSPFLPCSYPSPTLATPSSFFLS